MTYLRLAPLVGRIPSPTLPPASSYPPHSRRLHLRTRRANHLPHGTSTRAEEEDAPVAPPASSAVARKPSPSPVPAVAPTNEPPYTLPYLGFEYQRKNDNKKSVQYWCKSHRSKKDKCEGEVRFTKNKTTGEVDYDNPDFRNTSHTCTCFVKNKAPLAATLLSPLLQPRMMSPPRVRWENNQKSRLSPTSPRR